MSFKANKEIFILISILLMVVILSGCNSKGEIESNMNVKIDNFTFINQDGVSYGLKELKGKVWIADFVFTNCETVCPPMTFNMSKLQKMLKEENIKIDIVSFSVDPEVDTPEILRNYAEKFDADFSNWHWLTGYEQKEIEDFALNSFKTVVKKPTNEDQVLHGTSFYLINQEGIVIKDYSGVSEVPFDEMINDIKVLSEQN